MSTTLLVTIILVLFVFLYYYYGWSLDTLKSFLGKLQTPVIKKGNLLPPVSQTPYDTDLSNLENDKVGPGWTGSDQHVGRRPATLYDFSVNPTGEQFFVSLSSHGSFLSTTVNDLVIGHSYKLGGYAQYMWKTSVLQILIDEELMVTFNKEGTNEHKLREFGPFTVQAKARQHTIKFRNESEYLGEKVFSFQYIVMTGMYFEHVDA
jgi:hypothetical protein